MSTSQARENRLILNGDPAGRAWREAPVATLPLARRIRNVFNGRTIADTTSALIVFEHDHLPVYYVPEADIDLSALVPSDKTSTCSRKGHAGYWSIVVGDRTAPDAVWGYGEPIEGAPDLQGYRAFYWDALDHWYEEDEEVFVHARDPFKRVDALRSSRHVRIEIDGVTVAESHRPTLLFETGIATRYYLPRADVRLDLLRPTETVTACPYKGEANYYSAVVGDRTVDDIAWTYTIPIPEIPKIEQLVAFFDEHVDTYVDGELQPRPQSPWS
ncbi:MAG: hypothetical protein JWO74_2573 [Solirubrobacterales bacterium]|nr:hypothetical protein [Solirubrobacterales bacterium]